MSKTKRDFLTHIKKYSGTPHDTESDNRSPFSRYVMGVGDLSTAIMAIVGEAPGETEVGWPTPTPFVGKSGKTFNRILAGAGLHRDQCYITNVIKERPPNNNIKVFLATSGKNIHETKAFKFYRDYLKTELKSLVSPVILALGATAMYALTGHHNLITKRRGSIYPCILNPTKKVVVAVHPQYCDRQYIYTHISRYDYKRAYVESKNGLPAPTESRTLMINPTFEECCQYLEYILKNKFSFIGCDIETSRMHVTHISFAHDNSYAISIPFSIDGKNTYTLEEEAHIWSLIAKVLENPEIHKGFHNGAFDWMALYRDYGIVIKSFTVDTMVGQGISYPDLPKSLDLVTSIYSREPYYKDELKVHKTIPFGGADMFQRYSAKDSLVIHDSWPAIYANVNRSDNIRTYTSTMELIEPLVFMMDRGILIDKEAVKFHRDQISDIIDLKEHEIQAHVGYDINPNSDSQLKIYFYDQLKLKPYINRETKTPRTDEDALIRIANQGIEIARKILEYRKIRTMRDRYYNMILDNGRLKCSLNPVGAADTGRLSARKYYFTIGGNMQTLPHPYKRFMLADPGYMIFEIDYRQAELYCIAYMGPEHSMIYDIENGVDLHMSTASKITGLHPSQINKELRKKKGKEPNFGFNYGQTASGYSQYHMIPLSEARDIRSKYLASRPGIASYWTVCKSMLSNTRTITNPFGRSRIFLDRWDAACRQAYDYLPQSTVAGAINEFGIKPAYYRSDYFKELELLLQIHDSIIFQIPISIGWEAMAKMINDLVWFMRQPIHYNGITFNLEVDIIGGLNLAIYDENENLKNVFTHGKSREFKLDSSLATQLYTCYMDMMALDSRGIHWNLPTVNRRTS